MTKQRTTKADVAKEIKNAEKRLKTIERHTGARLSLNVERIMNDPNRARALENLKNISWNKLEQGKSFQKGFVDMTVSGKYWTAKSGWITTETEVQEQYVPRLLKATAKREKITGQRENISISGNDNIEKAIKYKNYYKTRKQFERHERRKAKTVMNNFTDNLQAMIDTGELSPAEVRKMKKLKALIRKSPEKWKEIIDKHKLYDIAGVNMYDSDEQLVDLKNNYDSIIATIEEEVGDIDKLSEEQRKSARKMAQKEAERIVKRDATKSGNEYKLRRTKKK